MKTLSATSFAFLLCLAACGDKPANDAGETGTGTETATETGVADEVGESTSSTSTTSTDTGTTESTTESTTDGSCPIGSEGCPCTGGGACDPGLTCDGGLCTMAADTTTDTGTDTTGGGDPLYQACPGGEDAECAPGEVCITGAAQQGQLPWSMCTSGTCMGDDDCAVDDNDICADLPGDGQPIDYCVPMVCDDQNPCPDPMACVQGFGPNTPSVCVWPI